MNNAANDTFAARSVSTPMLDLKIALDVVGSIVLLAFFSLLMIIIYATLMLRGGKPIYADRRVGKDGKIFHCYKFRSMVKDADKVLARHLETDAAARAEWQRAFKLTRDPRITPLGSFLRVHSLDELPQLVNVLKGDMSLVGPRPLMECEVATYPALASYYRCRPGITGLWQVSGRNDVDYATRVRLNTIYARRQSVWLDLKILWRTIGVVMSGRGAY